jgi:hypothetical protein
MAFTNKARSVKVNSRQPNPPGFIPYPLDLFFDRHQKEKTRNLWFLG